MLQYLMIMGPVLIAFGFLGKILEGSPLVTWFEPLAECVAWVAGSFHWFVGLGVFIFMIMDERTNIIISAIAAIAATVAVWMIGGFI